MPSGPFLIFDKSFLESLNPDEAALLDNFFMCNITPIFFAETLADLEKKVRAGRTPEQVVGSLAYKTPDMQANISPIHSHLIQSELRGLQKIEMNGRMYRSSGKIVDLGGSRGVVFQSTQEEQAFERWKDGEFLELERQIAKHWRRELTRPTLKQDYEFWKELVQKRKPRTLFEARHLADGILDVTDQHQALIFGMSVLGVDETVQKEIVDRWIKSGSPFIREFAPYFHYVCSVELFFFLSIGSDLISRIRPDNKADNKIDISYLYYLPFCMSFVSSDKLHERVIPLFARDDQSFIRGADLKADLKQLDVFYDALPVEEKDRGLIGFANHPARMTHFS